jgi:hypothetical protein
MHPERPLQPHERALHARQEQQREKKGKGQPYRPVHPDGRRVATLHPQHAADNDVGDNADGEVGGCIIGTMVVQFSAARGAAIGHLEEPAKQPALAAARTTQAKAAPHRAPHAARPRVARLFDHVTGHGLFSGEGGGRETCINIGSIAPTLQHDKCTRRLRARAPRVACASTLQSPLSLSATDLRRAARCLQDAQMRHLFRPQKSTQAVTLPTQARLSELLVSRHRPRRLRRERVAA